MPQPEHAERARLAILLATMIMVALGVAFVWLHIASPSDGARLAPGEPAWRSNGVVVSALRTQPAGLRTGDLVVAVDGRSLQSWAEALADPTVQRPQWQFGQVVTYSVIRDDVSLDVPVTLGFYPMDAIWNEGWSTIVFALVFALVALYVALRRPHDWAPLVLLVSASGILGATTWTFGLQVSDLIGGAGFWLYKATTSIDFLLFYIAALHFVLVFPHHHAYLARHPRLIWALYLTPFALDTLYLSATGLTSPHVLDWIGRANAAENLIVAALALAVVVSVTWTYRASRDAETRTKIRWLVFGALVSAVSGLVLWQIPPLVLGHSLISANALGLLVLPFPLAIAIAILRHHLFDIDTVLNRTLVYGGLSGIIAGIYIAIVAVLGTLFQARGNLLIALVAAGVVAVLFQPLRVWLQRMVDRVMFGERDNPYAVLSRLGQRLETALAPESVLPAVAETVAQALKLPSVAIAMHDGERLTPDVAYGVPVGAPVIIPLVYQREVVGQLRVSRRAPDEQFSPAEKHLLEDIAHQVGIAVHATRLTDDLQRSRARLVTAREEERRRIRRDLHDGIGPALAGMTLKVGAIRNVLASDPAAAGHMVDELGREIESAIGDIRRLVYALRPPALDELGLVAALRAFATHGQLWREGEADAGEATRPHLPRVSIVALPNLPPLPAATEVAAYRIACEALTNAIRHANARTCHITLTLDYAALRLEIADDGVGLPPDHRAGVGFVSMRERAEELGGTCAITSAPGEGVRIVATLPLAKE